MDAERSEAPNYAGRVRSAHWVTGTAARAGTRKIRARLTQPAIRVVMRADLGVSLPQLSNHAG